RTQPILILSVSSVSLWFNLFLQDRQVVVRYLQDDARHCRAVMGADEVRPRTLGALARQQFLPDGGEPLRPVFSTGGPHRLGGVVVAVEVVHVVARELPRRLVLHQEIKALLHVLVFVDAGAVQGTNPGGGAGKGLDAAAAALGHVAEPAFAAVLAKL